MTRCLGLLCVMFAVIGCQPPVPPPPSKPFGSFEGVVDAIWSDDGRTMTLNQDFAFVDPRQKKWLAPNGSVIDGASIPRAFWSIIGGPFEGPYRNASVVHDVACDDMKEKWEDVHLMFYEACRCGGVEESKAKLMYWAVYHFGPQWRTVSEVRKAKDGKVVETVRRTVRVAPPGPSPDEALARKADEYFASHNPTLEEIKSLKLDTQ